VTDKELLASKQVPLHLFRHWHERLWSNATPAERREAFIRVVDALGLHMDPRTLHEWLRNQGIDA
jgi:hypothetical protein